MNKLNKKVSLLLILSLILMAFAGCGSTEEKEFTYSTGIDENGLWEGITALEYVDLCDYSAIPVPADIHSIPEDQIQAEVDSYLSEYTTTTENRDRAVKDGDTVNIDYVGSVDGVEFEGGNTEGAGTEVIIGYTSYIDDFLEQLIGHMPGETFNVEVTFPDDYGTEEAGNANLNGKDAVFVTTINHIVDYNVPTLSDTFVAENLTETTGWTTVQQMKDGIKENLRTSALASFFQDYIVTNSTVNTLPESMLEYQKNSLVYYYEQYADYYQIELAEFLTSYMGVATTDELLAMYEEDNTATAKFYLLAQAIAEQEGISVTEEDVSAYFLETAGTEDYSQLEEYYGTPYLYLMVRTQAVMDHLESKAVFE